MIRKIVLGGALALGLLAVPAGAQNSPPSVLPNVIERPAVVVQAAPLPRTGGDIDAELLVGVGLTAAGAALAVTARQRRRRFAEATAS
jgi:LPXTG-motif cell wall-anchored protein